MAGYEADADEGAFVIHDLWRPSSLAINNDPTAQIFQHHRRHNLEWHALDLLTGPVIPLESSLSASIKCPSHLLPPELTSSGYGVWDDISKLKSTYVSSELPSIGLDDGQDERDLWLDRIHDLSERLSPPTRSWEAFYNVDLGEPCRYLSELEAGSLDLVLGKKDLQKSVDGSHRPIYKQTPALHALNLLALGYSSPLFLYGPTGSVQPRVAQATISGLSEQITESLTSFFAECGQLFLKLRRVADKASTSKSSLITSVALANVTSTAINELSFTMSEQALKCRTLTQLKSIYERPVQLLQLLWTMTELVQSSPSEVAAIADVFTFVSHNELRLGWMHGLLFAILERVTAPWLRAMSSCLGLRDQLSYDQQFHAQIEKEARDHSSGQGGSVVNRIIPSFIPVKDAKAMLETCSNFFLLKDCGHDLATISSTLPGEENMVQLRWMFKEHELQNNLDEIMKREKAFRNGSHPSQKSSHFTSPIPSTTSRLEYPSLDPYGQSKSLKKQFADTISQFERLPRSQNGPHNDIVTAVKASLEPHSGVDLKSLAFPLSLAPHFSFAPVIESQQRILGRECLRMLLREHGLREHLVLHHRYHLFGDGIFAARLSQALFSTELSTIEKNNDYSHSGTYGLRLGERNTWPPGGSELRIVLMGILNESYFGSYRSFGGHDRKLPGGLSFAIRNMSESEIELTMDPQALEALDFLRLQYTPPSPLHMILTESALDKYDTVFKFLLRVSRLLALTVQMAAHTGKEYAEDAITTRFRIVASRFMEATSSYFLQTAIAQPWASFEVQLIELERSCNASTNDTYPSITSINDLRAAHDETLDAILFGLLLRQRQASVMKLLEEIFNLILRFSQMRQQQRVGGVTSPNDIRELYDTFCAKVSTFLMVCQGLKGIKSHTKGTQSQSERQSDAAGEGIEGLIIRLNLNGWWS